MTREEARAQARGRRGGPPGQLPSVDRFLQQREVWSEMVGRLSDASLWALVSALRDRYRGKGLIMEISWTLQDVAAVPSARDLVTNMEAERTTLDGEAEECRVEVDRREAGADWEVP